MKFQFQQKLLKKYCNRFGGSRFARSFYLYFAFESQPFPLNDIQNKNNYAPFYCFSLKKPKRSYLCGSVKSFTSNFGWHSNYCSSFQFTRPNKLSSRPMRTLTKLKSFKKPIESISIGLASPEQILKWAERVLPNGKIVGQVTSPQTLNYKTLKPEKGGLFCERIFGPVKDYECACGKKKMKSHQRFCNECEVELTSSRVRRYRLGYIQLDSPVTHVWFLKGMSSYISILLNLPRKKVESIAYCTKTISTSGIPSSNNFVAAVRDQTTLKKSLGDKIDFYEIPFITNSNDLDNKEVLSSGALSVDEAETFKRSSEARSPQLNEDSTMMLSESQDDPTNSKFTSWAEPSSYRLENYAKNNFPNPKNNLQEPLFLSDYEIELSKTQFPRDQFYQPNEVQPTSETSSSVDFVSFHLGGSRFDRSKEVQLYEFSQDVIFKKFKTNQPKMVFDIMDNLGQTSKLGRKQNNLSPINRSISSKKPLKEAKFQPNERSEIPQTNSSKRISINFKLETVGEAQSETLNSKNLVNPIETNPFSDQRTKFNKEVIQSKTISGWGNVRPNSLNKKPGGSIFDRSIDRSKIDPLDLTNRAKRDLPNERSQLIEKQSPHLNDRIEAQSNQIPTTLNSTGGIELRSIDREQSIDRSKIDPPGQNKCKKTLRNFILKNWLTRNSFLEIERSSISKKKQSVGSRFARSKEAHFKDWTETNQVQNPPGGSIEDRSNQLLTKSQRRLAFMKSLIDKKSTLTMASILFKNVWSSELNLLKNLNFNQFLQIHAPNWLNTPIENEKINVHIFNKAIVLELHIFQSFMEYLPWLIFLEIQNFEGIATNERSEFPNDLGDRATLDRSSIRSSSFGQNFIFDYLGDQVSQAESRSARLNLLKKNRCQQFFSLFYLKPMCLNLKLHNTFDFIFNRIEFSRQRQFRNNLNLRLSQLSESKLRQSGGSGFARSNKSFSVDFNNPNSNFISLYYYFFSSDSFDFGEKSFVENHIWIHKKLLKYNKPLFKTGPTIERSEIPQINRREASIHLNSNVTWTLKSSGGSIFDRSIEALNPFRSFKFSKTISKWNFAKKPKLYELKQLLTKSLKFKIEMTFSSLIKTLSTDLTYFNVYNGERSQSKSNEHLSNLSSSTQSDRASLRSLDIPEQNTIVRSLISQNFQKKNERSEFPKENSLRVFSKDFKSFLKVSLWSSRSTNIENTFYLKNVQYKREQNSSWSKPNFFSSPKDRSPDTRMYKESPFKTFLREHTKRQEADRSKIDLPGGSSFARSIERSEFTNSVNPNDIGFAKYSKKMKSHLPLSQSTSSTNAEPKNRKNSKGHSAPFNLTKIMKNLVKPYDGSLRQSNGLLFSESKIDGKHQSVRNWNRQTKENPLIWGIDRRSIDGKKFFSNEPVSQLNSLLEPISRSEIPPNSLSANEHSEFQPNYFPPIIPQNEFNFINQINNNFRSYENEFTFLRLFNSLKPKSHDPSSDAKFPQPLFDRENLFSNLGDRSSIDRKPLNELDFQKNQKESLNFFSSSSLKKKRFQFEPHIDSVLNIFQLSELNRISLINSPEAHVEPKHLQKLSEPIPTIDPMSRLIEDQSPQLSEERSPQANYPSSILSPLEGLDNPPSTIAPSQNPFFHWKTLVNNDFQIAALKDFVPILKDKNRSMWNRASLDSTEARSPKLISLDLPTTNKPKVIKQQSEIFYKKQKLKTIEFLFHWIAYEKPLETEFLLNEKKWSKELGEVQSDFFSSGSSGGSSFARSMELISNWENWNYCTSPNPTSLSRTWAKLSPVIRFNKKRLSFSEFAQRIDSSFANNFISLGNSLRSLEESRLVRLALKTILKLHLKEKNGSGGSIFDRSKNIDALVGLGEAQSKEKSITFQNFSDQKSIPPIERRSILPINNKLERAERNFILPNEPIYLKSIFPIDQSDTPPSSIALMEQNENTPINEKFLVQPIDIDFKRIIEDQSPLFNDKLFPIAKLSLAQTHRASLDLHEQRQLREAYFLENGGLRTIQLALWSIHLKNNSMLLSLIQKELWNNFSTMNRSSEARSPKSTNWEKLSEAQFTQQNSSNFKIDTWLNILNYLFNLKILSWINQSPVMLQKPIVSEKFRNSTTLNKRRTFLQFIDSSMNYLTKKQQLRKSGVDYDVYPISGVIKLNTLGQFSMTSSIGEISLLGQIDQRSIDRAKLDPPAPAIGPLNFRLIDRSEISQSEILSKTNDRSEFPNDQAIESNEIALISPSDRRSIMPSFEGREITSSEIPPILGNRWGPGDRASLDRLIKDQFFPQQSARLVSYTNQKRNKGILLRTIDTLIPSLFHSNEVQISQKVLHSEIPKILRIQKAKEQLDQTITNCSSIYCCGIERSSIPQKHNLRTSDSPNKKQLLTKPGGSSYARSIDIKSKLLFLNNWGVFRLGKLIKRRESDFHLGELIFDQSCQSYFDIPIERNEIHQIEPISLLKKKKSTQNKFYTNLKKNINNGLQAKSHLVSLLKKKKIWNNTTSFPILNDNDHVRESLNEYRLAQLDTNIVFRSIERSSIPHVQNPNLINNQVLSGGSSFARSFELREKFFDSVLEYKLKNPVERLGETQSLQVKSSEPIDRKSIPALERNEISPSVFPKGQLSEINYPQDEHNTIDPSEHFEQSEIPPSEIRTSSIGGMAFRAISKQNPATDFAKRNPHDSFEPGGSSFARSNERSVFESSSNLNTSSGELDSNYFDFAKRNPPEDLSNKDTPFSQLENQLIEDQSHQSSETRSEGSSEAQSDKTKSPTSEITLHSNKYYSVLQTQQWESQDHWECFLNYMTENPKKMDFPIFSYKKQALPNQTPLTGGGAIQHLLKNYDPHTHLPLLDKHIRIELLNLNSQIQELEELLNFEFFSRDLFIKIYTKLCGLRSQRTKILRRLKLIRNFRQSKLHPDWMVLSILPVLPPDLRPIVQLDGNQVGVSDINKLYKLVLVRNQRIKRLRQGIYSINNSIEMRYSQRLLQEGVDALLSTGKVGANSVSGSAKPPLKSLSNILKGKKGRFRQNLLGKRVDYSGRSVIVVGPKLKIHECGLPKEMAIELFQPFLIRRLISQKIVKTVLGAKRLIQAKNPIIWNVLRHVLQNHLILLNRAPTLHRLGIQAFQPKLIEGRAILLHPLVCTAFNADFDGDQMAVHVPLSFQARAEAWKLICSINNLLSPATGQPIVVPSQDMVLGCYYLTTNDLLSESKYILWNSQQNPVKQVKKELQSNKSEPNLGDLASLDRSSLTERSPISSTFSSWRIQPKTLLTKDFPFGNMKTSLYGYYFLNFSDVLKKYYENKIDPHMIVWVSWNNDFEDNAQNEQPLEIRIQSIGCFTKIYTKYQASFDLKGQLISQIIRTTAGRVVMNSIIN